jgi:hypothetical protein
MGHRKHVGLVSDETVAGTTMLRVEAVIGENVAERRPFFYGGSAIFGLRPITEDEAREAVQPPTWARPQLQAAPTRPAEVDEERPLIDALVNEVRVLLEAVDEGDDRTLEERVTAVMSCVPQLRQAFKPLADWRGPSSQDPADLPPDSDDDIPC